MCFCFHYEDEEKSQFKSLSNKFRLIIRNLNLCGNDDNLSRIVQIHHIYHNRRSQNTAKNKTVLNKIPNLALPLHLIAFIT